MKGMYGFITNRWLNQSTLCRISKLLKCDLQSNITFFKGTAILFHSY
jgi:hypothetical protein